MDTSTDMFLGKVVHGYRLERLLGRGALTSVYRASGDEEGTVKTLIATILLVQQTLPAQSKERFRARFFQTAKQLEALHHPSICPFYGYGELEGYCYLLSPDSNGQTLSMYMARKKSWTSQEILALLTPIAEGLAYLHSQGVVCQFFSPANVFLPESQEDARFSIQLTSIGFLPMLCMKGLEEYPLAPYENLKSVAGSYLGNPAYLAPEIVKGMEGDASTDVYSLGILLFTLLSGSPPFTGESYLEIAKKHIYEPPPSLQVHAPDLPVALELVINRALYQHPAFRFQNPNELVAAYIHVINERVNAAQDLNIAKNIQQTYKMAAVEPRLLPPGAKRTVEIRSLSLPFVESDHFTTQLREQTRPALPFALDNKVKINGEKSKDDIAGLLPEKAEESPAETIGDRNPPLEKTEQISLSSALVPSMVKISSHISMFASELSGFASRFTSSGMTAYRSSLTGMKNLITEEKLDYVKDLTHTYFYKENKGEENESSYNKREEEAKNVAGMEIEGRERKEDEAFELEKVAEWKPDEPSEEGEIAEWEPNEAFELEKIAEWKPAESSEEGEIAEWEPNEAFELEKVAEWKPAEPSEEGEIAEWEPNEAFELKKVAEWKPAESSAAGEVTKRGWSKSFEAGKVIEREWSKSFEAGKVTEREWSKSFEAGKAIEWKPVESFEEEDEEEDVQGAKEEAGNSQLNARDVRVSRQASTWREASDAGTAGEIAQSKALPAEFRNFYEEKAPKKKILEKIELEDSSQATNFEATHVKEAHVEITTMISQIQQLRKRLQKQEEDHKKDDDPSAINDEKNTGDIGHVVKAEEFPGWLN